jgi:cytidylate kinase
MAVVTISRGLGSLGEEVAEQVAAELGYVVVSRDLINQAAQRAGAPEMALAFIDDLGLLSIKLSRREQETYRRCVEQVMVELADAGGAVILGRAGCAILASRSDALHVRVCAPLPVRCERVAASAGIGLAAALTRIEASDRSRATYVRRHYKVDWEDATLYDLVVNTAHVSPTTASDLICTALRGRQGDTRTPRGDWIAVASER